MPPPDSSAEAGHPPGAPRRVLVLGAGAIGGLLGARLAESPALDVLVAARRSIPGLTFSRRGPTGDSPPVTVPVTPVVDPASLPPLEWVVVATKTYDTARLGAWLGTPATAGARILVAQNGVEHRERMAPFADPTRVVPAIVTYGAERRGPGRVVQTLDGLVRVPADDAGRDFARLAAPTSLRVEVVEDFVAALWTKLAYNVVGNSLTTITDLPVRELGRRPELRRIAAALVAEVRAVAATRHATLPPELAESMLDEFAAFPATVRSSMWQDLHAGRRFEHDAISGALVRVARLNKVDAPFSQMATDLLETLSPVRASPSP
ncbi:2-dehydropantoate 2-reductase [Micromonospora zingiberis]|uniref:2-dehydropantoate 2-reductase n=1 Tax=Micromonospora zingiberis TaxID=2053011 RepID=A0A4R0GJB3_9ACTN|nr:2-dehydropantoate 2-reductase [Micromonospora zingiberis]TCB95478.1 2-dehydropantoate 2-reductase [Micromonospora zingiberis]